jgi:hypothetical protein
MVLAFLMIFAGVKTYRDNFAGGTVSFGKALQVGLLIMLIASVCYVATWQFVYHYRPDYLDKYAAYLGEAGTMGRAPSRSRRRPRRWRSRRCTRILW